LFIYSFVYLFIYLFICLFIYLFIYLFIHLCIYNHDRLHRICPISTLRVWTEKNTQNIRGKNIWGIILECISSAKANANTTQFHWFSLQTTSSFCFIVLRHRSWGVPFGELEKLILFIQYKKKLIISGDLFFLLKRSSLGTSDIQGCYSQKEITYMIYTLIHGRDPIPCRTTYIEYRSPVKKIIIFLRNTTQFHWFSWQNSFFHSSTTPVVGGTLRWAWKTHF